MSDISGLSSRTPLAFYDPDSSSWKTSRATFLSDSTSCSLTLPASGMTLGGVLYALPMLGPATDAPGSSLLPTPSAQESDPTEEYVEEMRDNFDPEARMYLPGRKWHAQRTLSTMARMLPTPTSRDHKGRNQRDDETCLPGAVGNLLPTPSAADGLGGHERRGGARTDELLLAGVAKDVTRLLPTPTAMDSASSGCRKSPSDLSLTDVVVRGKRLPSSGEPTERPSTDTPAPSVEQLRIL